MKRKPTKQDKARFAQALIDSLVRTFADVYKLHAKGMTQTELLIQHDIFAAATNHAAPIKRAHRAALLSAVDAYDSGVPLRTAAPIMRARLITQAWEIINGTKTRSQNEKHPR
jgi:hypothetical protein